MTAQGSNAALAARQTLRAMDPRVASATRTLGVSRPPLGSDWIAQQRAARSAWLVTMAVALGIASEDEAVRLDPDILARMIEERQ